MEWEKSPLDAAIRVCSICADVMFSEDDVQVDHIVPVSKGGTHARENLRVTHAQCNLKRSAGYDVYW
jgi:5-methylcytosine-specific restriction endonuclease McrA